MKERLIRSTGISRRQFLGGISLFSMGLCSSGVAIGGIQNPRTLAFNHTHTGEKLVVTYYEDGQYLPDALAEIDHLLRDFRTEEIHKFNLGLLDHLHDLKTTLDQDGGTFEIISAYRSPKTNEMLRNQSTGVAKKSYHMKGEAIDVRLAGVRTKLLRDAAVSLKAGGVGYYSRSDFIHLDMGRVRSW